MKVNILYASVVFGRGLFGELIGKVFSSLLPVEAELFLIDATPHPVEAHVKCFGEFRRMLPVRMPWEVSLSVLIGVGG